jgi:NAD(P)-dependent dehydrogenase (short-subunit alcohol dehydrogenase family)
MVDVRDDRKIPDVTKVHRLNAGSGTAGCFELSPGSWKLTALSIMDRPHSRSLVITGATGYLGRPLAALALERGYRVCAVVRPGSEGRVPPGGLITTGDPFAIDALAASLSPDVTLVHLIGTPARWRASTRERAERLGLVTDGQMVVALISAVERRPAGASVIDVAGIRAPACRTVRRDLIRFRMAVEVAFRRNA